MADEEARAKLTNHTWSIHLLASSRRTGTSRSQNQPLRLPNAVEELQEDATNYLRQRTTSQEKEGHYIRLSWIAVDQPPAQTTSAASASSEEQPDGGGSDTSSNAGAASRKRRRTITTESHKHLYVEVRLNEEWSASVVFCFYHPHPQQHAFDLCLARGLKSSCEVVWQWMSSTVAGCGHIGRKPLRLSPSDLAYVVGATVTATTVSEQDDDEARNNKPLVLTYETHVVPGIDTLSLTVPPQSLSLLCRNIERERSRQRNSNTSNSTNRRLAGTPSVSSAVNTDVGSDNDSNAAEAEANIVDDESVGGVLAATAAAAEAASVQSRNSSNEEASLPIVKGMQCFVQEHFCMDVSRLRLGKIGTASVSLGCDGRCKLVILEKALPVIREIVVRHRERQSA